MGALKHNWSIGHNYLGGITAGKWWQLLREVNFDVDAVYAHRVAFVSAMSLNNTVWAAIESAAYGKRIAAVDTVHAPLFVLGHWRSGTTHLHNLLCQDDDQFAFANTYQATNPHTFLTTEALNSRLFGWLVPKTRPMDNMALSFAEPQEDELGLSIDSLRSLYLGISFPRLEPHFAQYLTFEHASPADRERFKQSMLWLVNKLTLKYDKPVILKSPSHTARVALILELFPNARFVHIHRDPYDVFLSSQKYFDTAVWYTYLQRPDRSKVNDEILRRYTTLFDGFFAGRDKIPPDQFHEMSYTALERDPVGEVQRTYAALGLGDFDQSRLQHYVDSLQHYRKNEHPQIDAALKTRVADEWARSFDTWGYAR